MMLRTALFQAETYWRAGMPFHEAIRQVLANALTADAHQSAARDGGHLVPSPCHTKDAEPRGQIPTAVDVSDVLDSDTRGDGPLQSNPSADTEGCANAERGTAKDVTRPTPMRPDSKGPAKRERLAPHQRPGADLLSRPTIRAVTLGKAGQVVKPRQGFDSRSSREGRGAADLEEGTGPVYLRPIRFGRLA